jgi:hypothetical protein
MKIHSLTRLLYLPLMLIIGYYLYQMSTSDYSDHSMIIVAVVAITILYVSQAYIDNWWLNKNTPNLDEPMKVWLKRYLPYYNTYNASDQAAFDKRLVLYVETREFKSVGTTQLREVPYDIKNIIASQGVRLCLGLEDYLIKDMDRIYLYKHPFPTPKFNQVHNVEIDVEDGLYIFSTEIGLPGIVDPANYYNIVLHGFAEAFVRLHQVISFPDVNKYGWERLELIMEIGKNKVLTAIGLPQVDLLPVHIVCFFEYTNAYEKLFPEEYRQFTKIFNQQLLK